MAKPSVVVEVSGREVTVTSPDKVFFKARGETKLDLIRYYQSVEQPLLATIAGRPTLMQRFPDGADGKSFFQKRVPDHAPDWLQTTIVSTPNGTTSNALVIADLAHLVWAVQQGCLGFHPWPYRAAEPAVTDELRIDLDPPNGLVFDQVREAAFETRTLLQDLDMTGYVKTTGNRGLHVYVPLEPRWDSYDVLVSSGTAIGVDFSEYLAARYPLFFGVILGLSFLLLMAVFRSVLVPLKAVFVNLLSIGAAYGVAVAVFSWGWGGSLIGVSGGGPIEPFIPMMLFAIVIRIGVD